MAGAGYGFFASIIGTGNAIKAILLMNLGYTKEKFIALMATSSFILNGIKIGIYSNANLLSTNDIPLIIALIIIAFLGNYVGSKFTNKISPKNFKKIIRIILIIVTIKLIFFY